MGIDLKSIRRIIYEEDFDTMSALEEHLRELEAQRSRIDSLIGLVQRSILSMKGENDQMNRPRGGSSLQWRAAPRRFVIE